MGQVGKRDEFFCESSFVAVVVVAPGLPKSFSARCAPPFTLFVRAIPRMPAYIMLVLLPTPQLSQTRLR
jgi:hypothetical protein